MKMLMNSTDALGDPGALTAEVMEDAATNGGENPAPEVSRDTAEIELWDESVDAAGHQVPERPERSEETDAERLVRAGSEEAAREQRVAFTVGDGDYPTE